MVGVGLSLFVASLARQTLTQIHNSMAPISASKAKRLAEKVRPPFPRLRLDLPFFESAYTLRMSGWLT